MKTAFWKKGIKRAVFVLAGTLFMLHAQMELQAAGTVTVTADKSSAAIGDTITIAVQTSLPEDTSTLPEVSVTYNADILTFTGCNVEYGGGGGGLITFTGQTAAMTFTAAQTGSVTVAAEAIIDDDGNNPATGSASITVGAQGGASSDATLYALEMNPGQMVPDFSPQVTDYKIIIENDVTDITVSGAVSDPGAQITAASGFKNLKEGTNQAIITVTAADGTSLSYHFTIERSEGGAEEAQIEEDGEAEEENDQISNGLEVTIDDIAYTVQTAFGDELLPDGCVKTESSFNGTPVEAALFEKGGMTLLYALTANGTGEFFIYNEANGRLQLFLQLRNIENRYIVPIQGNEATPAAFKESEMQWNNSYIPAYVLADASVAHANEFYLLYAVNNEGERGFYMYDTMEGTYQRFLNYTGAKTVAVNNGGDIKPYLIAVIVLAFLFIGSIILIVNMVITNRERKDEERQIRRQRAKAPEKKKPPVKRISKPQKEAEDEKEVSRMQEEAEMPSKTVVPQRTVVPQKAVVPQKTVTPQPQTVRPQVPIFTLERPPVQLTREAPPDQLDDDFEFEFISMDNE